MYLSFHSKQEVKDFYLARVRAHARADEIVKGKYWENGKGCAVGCTIHGCQHEKYEEEMGISQLLARLEDRIFENLPNDLAKAWPERFLEAIPVGKDLSNVWPKFAIFLLTDKTQCASRHPQCQIIANIIQQQLNGAKIEWGPVSDVAASAYAAYAAAAAATYAADAAYGSAAADAAAAAAYAAAADAATYAADAAYGSAAAAAAADAAAAAAAAAADAAAYAADAAYGSAAAAAAADVARKKAYIDQSEKLLELLRDA